MLPVCGEETPTQDGQVYLRSLCADHARLSSNLQMLRHCSRPWYLRIQDNTQILQRFLPFLSLANFPQPLHYTHPDAVPLHPQSETRPNLDTGDPTCTDRPETCSSRTAIWTRERLLGLSAAIQQEPEYHTIHSSVEADVGGRGMWQLFGFGVCFAPFIVESRHFVGEG